MTPPRTISPLPATRLRRVSIVASTYNAWVMDALVSGAISEYTRQTGSERGLVILRASGSFEVPMLVQAVAKTGRFDAIVALGCIIKGETSHDLHLATAVTSSLLEIALETGVPVGLGVLTVDSAEQAEARAGGLKGNKGVEAMSAALATAGSIGALRASFASRGAR